MATFDRFISGILRNASPQTGKFLEQVRQQKPEKKLTSDTIIDNYKLPLSCSPITDKPIEIIFTPEAKRGLNYLFSLEKSQRHFGTNYPNHYTIRPFEYLCLGHQDKNGNIVIEEVSIPAIEHFNDLIKEQSLEKTSPSLELYKSKNASKSEKDTATSLLYDYIKKKKTNPDQLATVALLGTTSPQNIDRPNTQFDLNTLARTTPLTSMRIPNPIITGAISHFTVDDDKNPKSIPQLENIEAVIVNHSIASGGFSTPINIYSLSQQFEHKLTPSYMRDL